ncbi:uncharacterized protein TNCV_4583801 [Trichonephila clavipes]|nr:uncharacterized protein TNCV_4583801 [Trichonephila clavipes]
MTPGVGPVYLGCIQFGSVDVPWPSSDQHMVITGTKTEHFIRKHNRSPLSPPMSSATRGLLATDYVILNHGQVTWTTPELAPPVTTTTPHQRDVSALDRFNVHRCPTRRVFSGTGLELVTRQTTIRYLCHSATAATASVLELSLK